MAERINFYVPNGTVPSVPCPHHALSLLVAAGLQRVREGGLRCVWRGGVARCLGSGGLCGGSCWCAIWHIKDGLCGRIGGVFPCPKLSSVPHRGARMEM